MRRQSRTEGRDPGAADREGRPESRAFAALARDTSKFVVQKGATQQEAETKAMAKCGALCQIAAWTCTK